MDKFIERVAEIIEGDGNSVEKAREINKLYLNSSRCSSVHVVINQQTGRIHGCFKKPKNAENYIGNNPRYVIEKLKVE